MVIINTGKQITVCEENAGTTLVVKINGIEKFVYAEEVGPKDAPVVIDDVQIYYCPGQVFVKDSVSDQTRNNGVWWVEDL